MSTVEGFRISPQQELYWQLQGGAGGGFFASRCLVRLSGSPEESALRAALTPLVERHEILRTRFERLAGMSLPVQVVGEPLPPTLAVESLEGAAELEARWRSRHSVQAFGATLLRLPQGDPYLLLELPSLCADAVAWTPLLQELAELYGAHLEGRPPALEEPPQYADLAEAFQELLESEDAQEGMRFWQQTEISGQAITLPFARRAPHSAGNDFRRFSVERQLSPETVSRLCEGEAGLEDLVFAGWTALLHRLTGEEVLSPARAFSGRNYEGLEEAVGLFVRHVPVTVRAENLPFSHWVTKVTEASAEAAEWQEYFSAKLSATGQMAVGFEGIRLPATIQAGPLAFTCERVEARLLPWQLLLRCLHRDESVRLELIHDGEAYDASAAETLLAELVALLDGAAARPETLLSRLDLLDTEARQRWVTDWNATAAPYPQDKTIHEAFARQAATGPARVAVRFPQGHWTYAELEARAGRVAQALRHRGLRPEEVVGVCLERSADLIAALLGILEAGGAYLALDPASPPLRSAYFLEDSSVRFVLTQPALSSGLPDGVELLSMDELMAESSPIEEAPVEKALPPIDPARLAYVLYTSGSTGRPKGVQVCHRSVVNYLQWVERELRGEEVRLLPLVTRPTFDACLKQIFGPLVSGQAVWILPPEVLDDPGRLLEEVTAQEAVGLNCVTSLWRAMLDEVEAGRVRVPSNRLQAVYVGGEKLTADLVQRTHAALPDIALWNLYGPTEVTANASAARLEPDQRVSLGRPLSNARVYLVDSNLQPVAPGLVGQIVVGGAGLARGYQNRPCLTAERFVPDPFAGEPEPGARLYQTGDLGRFLPDGTLEYLGRGDQQVKVRGIRIELEEIEEVLNRHPRVGTSAVALRVLNPEGEGDPSLVAYVVPRGPGSPQPTALRTFLEERLPAVMVPAVFTFLAELPRTSSGKLDRKALPTPSVEPISGTSRQARSAIQELLAAAWCDLLKVEQVGLDDNFYQLGGHSLLAVQLLSRLQQIFQVELPLRTVLDAGTLEELAAKVEAARAAASADPSRSAPPLVARPEGQPPTLSFSQERLWFLSQLDPHSPAYNIPLTLRLLGPLDVDVFRQTTEELFRRHEILRSSFRTVAGRPELVVHEEWQPELSVIDLTDLPREQRVAEEKRLAAEEAQRPFDLANEPLLRSALVRLGSEEWLLLASWHHIVTDGWSARVLVGDLSAIYEALAAGRSWSLPPLAIQYADYAAWQREWLRGDALERRLDHWRRRLASLVPTALPGDRPRPVVLSSRGETASWKLDPQLSADLRALARRQNASPFVTLLAAFKATLHALTGELDIVVGTDVVNRHRPETESLIGLFVNQVVLRTDLSGNPSFDTMVERVRRTVLEAFDDQELPFNLLMDAVKPERSLGRNPLFQLMFAYQNLPEMSRDFGGIRFESVMAESKSTVFDLSLYMSDTSDGCFRGVLRYSTDLFDPETMQRLWDRYQVVLRAVAAAASVRLETLSEVVEGAERQRRLDAGAELERAAAESLGRRRRRPGALRSEVPALAE